MGMEPAAAWGPSSEFQLTNCTVEEPAHEVWAPGVGLPLEYGSSDIFGTCCSLQAYVPESTGGQQLVQYNYCVSHEAIVDGQDRQEVLDPKKLGTRNVVSNDSYARDVFNQVEHEFKVDINLIKVKMHRYPVAFQDGIYKSYTTPRVVAIGPYHHHQPHLKQAEKVKHMAVIACVKESGRLLEEMYAAVASAADNARHLYDEDTMEGISLVDFRDMMFVDACFMVQYMLRECGIAKDRSLNGFLGPKGRDINHDVILLENQLPWKVVETVLELMPEAVPLDEFISGWEDYLQHRRKQESRKEEDDANFVSSLVTKEAFKPHLLGILRYYTVGSSRDSESYNLKPKSRSISVSAVELAEIGISLTANKTMKLIDMSLNQEGTLLAELSLAPLSLDINRASFLFNMAALELCTVESFTNAPVEESAVCSYLLLLALLVCRQEDVQELRVRGLLQGGGGLTDEESFRFLTSFQGLRFGRSYNHVMAQIEIYKESKWKEAKFYSFYYKNKKIIYAVLSGVGALVGIIGTLVSIKQSI